MQTPHTSASLDSYIVSTPDTLGGKPRIAGTRISVSQIKLMRLKLGMSFEEIAQSYNLELPAVYAAMAYYYAHKAEIDQHDAEDATFVRSLQKQSPSPLEVKVAALKHG